MTMLLEPAETTVTTADALACVDRFTRTADRPADVCTDASCVYCCGPETD